MGLYHGLQKGVTYPDCDILGGCKKPVDQDTHKGRVQAKLNGEFCQFRIAHTLRHDNSANRDT